MNIDTDMQYAFMSELEIISLQMLNILKTK